MKKIFAIVFMIIIMFCQVCVAFQPPDPNRWRQAGDSDEAEYWVDSLTAKFSEKSYGKSANVWVLIHIKKTDIENLRNYSKILENLEIDFDNMKYKILTTVFYDDNGKVEHTIDSPSDKFVSFIPDSMGEKVYITALMLSALEYARENEDVLEAVRESLDKNK